MQIVARSPLATRHIKYLVRGAQQWPVDDGMARERTLFCDLMVSPAGLEAMRQMVEEDVDIRDVGK